MRDKLLSGSKQETHESQDAWRASNDKTTGNEGTLDSASANVHRKVDTEPAESSRRSRSNTGRGTGGQDTPSRASKKASKGKKKRTGASSTSALSQKKGSVASSKKLSLSSASKPQKKLPTLTSNPLQYDAQLKQMGIKVPKDPPKAPKKPVTARVGAVMNKKLQAKFNSTQSKILKSLAPEVIEEARESPDSKHLTTHRSDLDISAIKPQDMTLSASSKAVPTVESPRADDQKLSEVPLKGSDEALQSSSIELVATVVARKAPAASPDNEKKTPTRRSKADRTPTKAGSLDLSASSARRKLACLIVPEAFNPDGEEVTTYELGSKPAEIETPTFQVNIAPKLQYSLAQADGGECPPMIQLKHYKTGKKTIKVYQKAPGGEERLYHMVLNVWNPDSGASGKYRFRVFCKPNI